MKPLHFLVLARDAERREQLVTLLRQADQEAWAAPDRESAADAIGSDRYDGLLLDLGLPDLDVAALRSAILPGGTATPDSLEAAERRHLARALQHTAGNKRQAANLLGISRSTLLNKVRKYGLLTTLAVGAASPSAAQEPRPIPDGRVVSGTLSFDGHATVGDFTGTTSTVSGQLVGAPDLSAVRGWVEAPVQSLRTGDGKRDKDLNKSMESGKYPTIRFELARIAPAGGAGDSVPVVLHGALVIHGVTRLVELPATIRFEGGTAKLRTDFPLNLKDYKVGGLSKLLGMLKMSEKIEVHGDLLFQFGPGQ